MVQRLRTQLKGDRSREDGVLKAKKWTRCLQGPGAKYCVIARQAGWWGPEGLTGKAKESHPLVQPHHQDCNHGMGGNLRYNKMTPPIISNWAA